MRGTSGSGATAPRRARVPRRPHGREISTLIARLIRALSFAALLLLAAAQNAAAQTPLLVEAKRDAYPLARALLYVRATDTAMTVEQVAALPRERFARASADGSEVNFGFGGAGYWFALPLEIALDAPSNWLLEIAFPALDCIEVFVPRPGGGFERQVAGDLESFARRPIDHRNFVFPVTLIPGTASSVYLFVQSAGSVTVPATLWQPAALASHDRRSYSALNLYYGLLIALALYNLLIWLSSREGVFLAYVGTVLSLALGMAAIDGLARQFLWPALPLLGNMALLLGLALSGLFGTLFTRCFLGTRIALPRIDRAILVFSAVFVLAGLSPLVAPYTWGAIVTTLAGLLFAALAVAAAALSHARGLPGTRWFLLAWIIVFAGVSVFAFRIMGWLPTGDFTLYAMHIGSGLHVLLLSFALAGRISATRREREAAQREALLARETLVESMRRSEHELEARVAERTRELDGANALLRENQHELERMARYDPLTGIANRLLLEDRVSQAVTRARRSGRSAAVLLIDLDGFKMINDTRGHAAGDQILKTLAERFTAAVRETDTVARLGGDEFVVLLEDLDGPEDAVAVAGKLLAEAREPFLLAAGGLTWISASIGLAFCPRDGGDMHVLLRRADEAMYAVKAAGRNGLKAYAEEG